MTSLAARPTRVAASLLAASLLLTACGEKDSGGADDPARNAYEAKLEALAGVDDARVEREAFDTDYWGEEIVVDMVADATADQVAAVLDSLTARSKKESPQESRVTLAAGDTDTAPDWYSADAPPFVVPADDERTNADLAALLVASAAALPEAGILVTESEWSIFVDSDDPDPRPAFEAVVSALRSDPDLADRRGVGITVNPNYPTDARTLQYNGALTEDSMRRWRDVTEVMDEEVVRSVSLYGTSDIWINVAVPDDVEPRDLTTEAYGDLLWPIIRHEIDILATFDEPAGLEITNLHGFGADYLSEDRFLDLSLGKPARRDRGDRTWNADAWAYLNR